jgi:hypothetical protein
MVLVALGGVFTILGAWLGPETRHVDLKEAETTMAPAEVPGRVATA